VDHHQSGAGFATIRGDQTVVGFVKTIPIIDRAVSRYWDETSI